MPKLLISFLFLIGMYLLTPINALAATTFSYTPNPLYSDSGSVTLTVENKDEDIFNPNLQYASVIYRPNANNKSFFPENQKKPESARKYSVTWTLVSDRAAPDTWAFKLCLGPNAITDCQQNIIESSYTILQKGGGTLALSDANSPLQIGSQPKAIIINSRLGITYSLWWDGAKRSFAKKYTAQSFSEGNITVDLEEAEVNYKKPGVKKLCMEVGDYNTPIGVTCHYSTTFDFKPTAPSQTSSCRVGPTTPYINDSVSIIGSNLPKNVDIVSVVKDSGGNEVSTRAPSSIANSGNNALVNITLFNKDSNIKPDNYTASLYIYPQQNNINPICTVPFKVTDNLQEAAASSGQPGSSTGAALTCTPGKDCTTAGGEPCKNDPSGIQTAIGCVHTDPSALIRDVFRLATGIGGGIAFLLMIFGAFGMITSAGNPDALKEGQQRFFSAIIGILFIVFSTLLLQIIGVDILSIPGFK